MKKLYAKKTFANTVSIKLMLFAVLLISAIYTSYGQVKVPFKPRTSDFTPTKTNYTVKGDFTMIGNTNLQLDGFGYPNNQNNNHPMKYVDIDSDINTWNSSSANLTFSQENGALPDCSKIIYAGLYWTGRSDSNNVFEEKISSTIINNGTISNTNYGLTISSDGSYDYFLFTSTNSGNSVNFRINKVDSTIQAQRNSGAWSGNIANNYSSDKYNFTSNYQISSDSNNTLEVSALKTQATASAYVNIKKSFDKHNVLLKGPSATTYENITAANNNIYYPTSSDGNMFSAYAEVTQYVQAHGLGNYFVADIALKQGNPDDTGFYGGWGMVVVYENSKMKWRDITVFDGHAYVGGAITANYPFDISGFNAVQNGDVNLKLGLMAGEGDVAVPGDYFQIKNRYTGLYESLKHSNNSTTNFFNSSIVTGGNIRNPNYNNNTGLDIAMFEVDNGNTDSDPSNNNRYITNNQTSTSFNYGSIQDTYVIFNITFSVDAYIPEAEVILSTTSVNTNGSTPGVLLPGESADYKIEIKNKGSEATTNTIITIPVPYTSTYKNLSILYNVYAGFTPLAPPIYDPNAGATGSIIWNLGTLPITGNPDEILADISFTLTATTDCSLLVNANCDSSISLGGSIAGTGANSNVSFNQQIIQGYKLDGSCIGEPIPTPNIVRIDSEAYVKANCGNYTAVRDFYFCNIGSTPVQTLQVKEAFPPGTKYYNEYPLTDTSIEYNAQKPFPSTIGTTNYYAIPPGSTACHYEFTINVTDISSVPTVEDISYCLNETASALIGMPSDSPTSPSAYKLFYYTDNNPATPAQTSIVPATNAAGVTTYYVAEGYSISCISQTRVPLKVTVYGEDPKISAPSSINIEGCDETSITISNSRFPFSATQSADIKSTYVATGYTASDDETITSITYIDVIDTTVSCPLVVTRTFTVTDGCGNTATAVQTITLVDTTLPVLTLPANASAECSADLSTIAFGNATATDNCDSNPIISHEDVETDGACPGSYTITRTWKATDACGNVATADQIISTDDTTAPEFAETNLPTDITIECSAIPVAETLTATDNCGTATVIFSEETILGDCINNYVIKRNWTATDACGISKTHIQTITVQDTTPPTFVEPLPAANLVVECDAIPTAETLTAIDACGTATVSEEDVRTDGSCSNNYTIARIWTATDVCGLTTKYTQVIEVRDTKAPTFVGTLPPTTATAECDAIPTAETLTATDICGAATVTVEDVKTNGDCPNSYTIARTWIATDACGLTTKHTQIITVQDTKAPVPASSFDEVLNVSCSDIPEVSSLTFTDNCSSASAITATYTETSTYVENVYKDYQIIRTWTVKDECNNEAIYTQTLNVALDEIITDILAPDWCFDEGPINLNNLTPDTLNTNGTWELLEGNPVATINGSIFDASNVVWDKNSVLQGLYYKFRYTTTDNGCVSINDVAMTLNYCKVLPCGENDVVISKAVTPNGDAYNEYFEISGIELCGFRFDVKIFNRWGALIYESNDYQNNWNGTASKASIGTAGKVPNGTYYYIVTIKDSGLAPLTGPVYLGTK